MNKDYINEERLEKELVLLLKYLWEVVERKRAENDYCGSSINFILNLLVNASVNIFEYADEHFEAPVDMLKSDFIQHINMMIDKYKKAKNSSYN